eukprot:690466-Amphidinium_carterae.2
MAKHFEDVDEDDASYAASQLRWTSREKLTGGGQRQGRGVHAGLDRELPGPVSPLLRKRRRAMLSVME